MEFTLSVPGLLAFAGTILVLGAAPTASSLLAAGNTLSLGAWQGCAVAIGIAVADTVYALVALLGLTALIITIPAVFTAVKIVCALLLVWVAYGLWRNRFGESADVEPRPFGFGRGFWAGLLVTVADQKAILFYAALMPAYFDLGGVSSVDIVAVCCTVGLSVLAPKLGYVFVASQGGVLFSDLWMIRLKMVTAMLLVAVAMVLIVSGVTEIDAI